MNRSIEIVNAIGLRKFDGNNFWLRPFHNGREDGIGIVIPAKGIQDSKIITFAEHRNDDSLTSIYIGRLDQFADDGTLSPSEETMWYTTKNITSAIDFIKKQMKSSYISEKYNPKVVQIE